MFGKDKKQVTILESKKPKDFIAYGLDDNDQGQRAKISPENVITFEEYDWKGTLFVQIKTTHGYYYVKGSYKDVDEWINSVKGQADDSKV